MRWAFNRLALGSLCALLLVAGCQWRDQLGPSIGMPERASQFNLRGQVFDRAGVSIAAPLTLTFTATSGKQVVQEVQVIAGQFSARFSAYPPVSMTVRGDGYVARERPVTFNYQLPPPSSPRPQGQTLQRELNFGGPATSNDPDAPAYYVPVPGEPAVATPPPITREDWTVTTVAGELSDRWWRSLQGLAAAPNGDIYAVDSQSSRIFTISPRGDIGNLAGTNSTGRGDVYIRDGVGENAYFYGPTDVAINRAGTAYVTDAGNCAIRQIAPDGTVTTLAGKRDYGYADGLGTEAKFHRPSHVALDTAGNLFVSDDENNCIRKVTPDGLVSTFAGTTEPGYANGRGSAARFRHPTAITVDKDDNVFVLDRGNQRIRKILPDGTVSTIYGDPIGLPDGRVLTPQVAVMSDIQADAAGHLFVSGGLADREVRSAVQLFQFRPDGHIRLLAGEGSHGDQDGTGPGARFSHISAIALDARGDVLISDASNLRVRRARRQ